MDRAGGPDSNSRELGAEEVGLEAGVALFVGPKSLGDGGEVVHEGDGVAVLGEVHAGKEKFAGIAGLDAKMGKLLGDVDGEFVFGFFAAGGAKDAAKFPFLRAEGAEKKALAAVAFGTKDGQ